MANDGTINRRPSPPPAGRLGTAGGVGAETLGTQGGVGVETGTVAGTGETMHTSLSSEEIAARMGQELHRALGSGPRVTGDQMQAIGEKVSTGLIAVLQQPNVAPFAMIQVAVPFF